MSKMIALRLKDEMLKDIDRERRRGGLTRAAVMNQALTLWIDQRRYREALRRDQDGYARRPVTAGEFQAVLGAQIWPE
jgi:Arc/MetJ-type ribon-helix-helix transcriptional regulator